MRQRSLTSFLIMINVIVFVLMFLFGGLKAFSNPRIYILFGAQIGNLISMGEWFRLITSMFVHGGLFHIFFNMMALFYVGNIVERAYGPSRLITIYMLSGMHLLNEKCTKNKSRLNEKCTTLSHKSCIMNLDKKIVQEEKKGDRDGTIQLYKIFVF